MVTIVYAKSTRSDRKELWNDIMAAKDISQLPWLIGGDFNAVLSLEEKKGCSSYRPSESIDFQSCING